MGKNGTIAFITTPNYRNDKDKREEGEKFIFSKMHSLCYYFNIVSTGGTHEFILDTLNSDPDDFALSEVLKEMKRDNPKGVTRREALRIYKEWKKFISNTITGMKKDVQGMIQISNDLVEGRIDGVIHLTHWTDIPGKPDSMVLRREANVHNVMIASDGGSASNMIETLIYRINKQVKPFYQRAPLEAPPSTKILKGKPTIALIAHDGMKLDMCEFFISNRDRINTYQHILATGTTGGWLKRFAKAANRPELAQKVICCLSGPKGGDVQIANMVVSGLCSKVIFFQDPFTSHPHENDIRLFEQSVLLFEMAKESGIPFELATNEATAKIVIGV